MRHINVRHITRVSSGRFTAPLIRTVRHQEGNNMLADPQEKFIEKRRRSVKRWKWRASLILVPAGAFWVYGFFRMPLLFNPFHFVEQMKTDAVAPAHLFVLASAGSMFGFLSLGLVLAFAIASYAFTQTEKKYLDIIGTLQGNTGEQRSS